MQKEEEKPREKEKGKTRNIDHFMEELKHEQEMREKRNQEREHWRDGRHSESSAVSVAFRCCAFGLFSVLVWDKIGLIIFLSYFFTLPNTITHLVIQNG